MNCSELCANFKPITKNRKIAIVVGHTVKSQGATAYNGESEYIFNSKVAQRILDNSLLYKNLECRVFNRNNGGISGAARSIYDAMGTPDVTLELHFNAYSKIAYGCECLITRAAGHDSADIITDRFNEEFGLKERNDDGVKMLKKGDRGYFNIERMHEITKTPIALLFEPCFANFKTKESEIIIGNWERYADFLSQVLFEDVLGF